MKITEDKLRNNALNGKYVNWNYISKYMILSEDFIREFKDKVYWYNICENQTLSEDFIKEFSNYVNWAKISYYQLLSEDFIEQFSDKVDWFNISYSQKLSEKFINKFSNKIYWHKLNYDNLSENFIINNIDKINIIDVFFYKIIPNNILHAYLNFIKNDSKKIKYFDKCYPSCFLNRKVKIKWKTFI